MNTRKIAIEIIQDIFENNSYNNITLKNTFEKNVFLSNEEKAFITELVNGTIRNIIYIDYILNLFSNTKTKKMKPFILNTLRISIYQIMFMPKIPQSAICNEAVNIVKSKKFNGLAGFVNAILRNIIRNKDDIKLPDKHKNPIEYLSIKYSYPQWIIKYWLEEIDFSELEKICQVNLMPPKISICVNTNKITKQQLKDILKQEEISFQDGKISKNSLYIFKTKDITKLNSFKNGYFHIMDESSMICAEVSDIKKGETAIDVCSAPGGKSFYLSYLMQNEGQIFSRDIHTHKIDLLNNSIKRLGIKIIKAQNLDATKFNKQDEEIADLVIIDAPCSGLGILRKKPDIKYNKTLDDIKQLSLIQKEILKNCSLYVKKGGTLIYSTCTISKKENIDNVNWFLENFDFKLQPIKTDFIQSQNGYIQILPSMFETDGFFIAKFIRNN